MKSLEQAIAVISPERALKREYARRRLSVIQNSGYSNYGANHHKSSTKGWFSAGGSSKEDIEDNLPTLRQRCRDLYMGVPMATSIIKTYRTSVIGAGLSLKPKVDAEGLGLTEEAAEELEKQIAREWKLWADSTECDAAGMSNFYELQQLAFMNWCLSGDVLITLPVWERRNSIYDMRINLIEADRCATPPEKKYHPQNRIVDGVETDAHGEVVAYYISTKHPLSGQNFSQDWRRVEVYGRRTGRRNILHLMNRERIGQVRGVPMLAPVIESLKQIGRYTEAELVAAVVNGYTTVFIERENETTSPVGEMLQQSQQLSYGDETKVEMAPGAIVDLNPGEKANAVQPGRPNGNFDGFVNAISKQAGGAVELPQELMMKQFTASYSASRGSLLEAWKTFEMYRDWMASGFCQPIFEEWMAEAVAKGRIHAPGFFADPAIRRYYTGAEWYGPAWGQLDPKKEVEAAAMRVQHGFSTSTKESMELTGTDFRDNMRQIKRERAMQEEIDSIAKNAEEE